jgi:hypothetical protein
VHLRDRAEIAGDEEDVLGLAVLLALLVELRDVD